MKIGKYGPGNTKFSKYIVSRFPLHLFNKKDYEGFGCGATALSLITGVNPAKYGPKKDFKERFMVGELRKAGFSVYQVNKANLTRSKKWCHALTDQNIVLYSAVVSKGNASWFVTNSGYLIHNFDVRGISYLDILSFPLVSAYVIYNKDWK